MNNNPPSPLELIRRHNLNLKKSLGQNLLIDTTHLTRIAAAADLTPADTVLEIGPGLGALTHHLAEKAGCVVAVELDQRLIPILREQFADQLHVSFVHGDILELCLSEIVHAHSACQTHSSPLSSKYKVVANLPYYITSAFLKHMLESLTPPSLAVLLLQREVAQRLVAQPGAMSILAVSVQFYARPRILNRIPAGAQKSTAVLCVWICARNPRSRMWTRPTFSASCAPASHNDASNCATALAPGCLPQRRTQNFGCTPPASIPVGARKLSHCRNGEC